MKLPAFVLVILVLPPHLRLLAIGRLHQNDT